MWSLSSMRLGSIVVRSCRRNKALVQCRKATTSSTSPRYPFPTHPRPTPHEIFHLPAGASKQDVKTRYYDLVRIHHPDSPHARHLDPSVRHSRFQSIRAAYDTLMGKGYGSGSTIDPVYAELERRRRTQEAYRRARQRAEFADGFPQKKWEASPDDRWKDRVIFAVGILCLFVGIGPAIWSPTHGADQVHAAASTNLAQARREAREFGEERRQEIRRRVRENQEQLAAQEKGS
ncbi:unnamed protein product [Somion occarium]|uniref:J domain-containing protein n=1 Tax=Somion occarium TaxID=3059160 RepID=A0ABP1E1D5_9APHY